MLFKVYASSAKWTFFVTNFCQWRRPSLQNWFICQQTPFIVICQFCHFLFQFPSKWTEFWGISSPFFSLYEENPQTVVIHQFAVLLLLFSTLERMNNVNALWLNNRGRDVVLGTNIHICGVGGATGMEQRCNEKLCCVCNAHVSLVITFVRSKNPPEILKTWKKFKLLKKLKGNSDNSEKILTERSVKKVALLAFCNDFGFGLCSEKKIKISNFPNFIEECDIMTLTTTIFFRLFS